MFSLGPCGCCVCDEGDGYFEWLPDPLELPLLCELPPTTFPWLDIEYERRYQYGLRATEVFDVCLECEDEVEGLEDNGADQAEDDRGDSVVAAN
jgi:hypothetical protein